MFQSERLYSYTKLCGEDALAQSKSPHPYTKLCREDAWLNPSAITKTRTKSISIKGKLVTLFWFTNLQHTPKLQKGTHKNLKNPIKSRSSRIGKKADQAE